MKKLIVLLVLAISITGLMPQLSQTSAAEATSSTPMVKASLGSLMTELETNVKWGAVYGSWKKRRDSWLVECQRANSAQKLGALLAEFESNVTWEMVEAGWRKRRDSWVADCQRATTSGQVASLLLELESNMKWASVTSGWKTRRDGWIREVSAAR
ncbi:MAG: hypothetical protein HY774_16430 [Acidobacteria bacterium]|nr:hypothetical protein [Acidobacteriota bacterium]